jgi:ferredoxin
MMMDRRITRRLPRNVPGRFYTTERCDGCAYCAAIAPEYFDYEKSTNQYFVCRQPRTPTEEEILREASDDCPLDAIQIDRSHFRVANGGIP